MCPVPTDHRPLPHYRLGDALAAQNGRRVTARQTDHTLTAGGDTSHKPPHRLSVPATSSRMTDTELEQSVTHIIDKMSKGVQVRGLCGKYTCLGMNE